MKNEIARLEINGIESDGNNINVVAKIGKPFLIKGTPPLWSCPVSITPLYEKLPDIKGVDSFQSLCLAKNFILSLLKGFVEKGGQLKLGDNTEFPLEAYTGKKGET
jgi:hypothetical protein